MDYQNLNTYAGSLYGEPRYQGIEYDWEVPDNLTIGSPGGVDSVRHHWTKGFYGRGNTSSDLYAGQDYRYISGIYGNLYNTGQQASENLGYYNAPPDNQYWTNEVPQQYLNSQGQNAVWAPTSGMNNSSFNSNKVEKYQKKVDNDNIKDDFDLLDGSEDSSVETSSDKTIPVWVIFLFLLFLFIAFDFWAEASHRFVSQYFHGGGVPSWQRSVLYATIVTVVFSLVIWLSGVPLTSLENVNIQ